MDQSRNSNPNMDYYGPTPEHPSRPNAEPLSQGNYGPQPSQPQYGQPFAAPPPPPGYVYAPARDPNISEKSGVALLLLHVLLPGWGISIFYSGKVGLGVLWLVLAVASFPLMFVLVGVFVWIALGIWWIVDLIAICTSSYRDADGRIIKL